MTFSTKITTSVCSIFLLIAGIAAPAQAVAAVDENPSEASAVQPQAIDWGNVLAQYNSAIECNFWLHTKWIPKYPSYSLGCLENRPAGNWVVQRFVAF